MAHSYGVDQPLNRGVMVTAPQKSGIRRHLRLQQHHGQVRRRGGRLEAAIQATLKGLDDRGGKAPASSIRRQVTLQRKDAVGMVLEEPIEEFVADGHVGGGWGRGEEARKGPLARRSQRHRELRRLETPWRSRRERKLELLPIERLNPSRMPLSPFLCEHSR